MFPIRLSLVTYNIWGIRRWHEREPALRQFVALYKPDVLCLQELSEESRNCLDEALPRHDRIHDDFPGWVSESNIYWNADLLEKIEHGAEDIGISEKYRRLFWTRLRTMSGDRSLIVATAHFAWPGSDKEYETGQSPRPQCTRRVIAALARLVGQNEPAFFMGDLNDPVLPTRILHEAGYRSCFAALGMQSPPTWKCYPTANVTAGEPSITETIDWIVANRSARTICAQVPRCYLGDIAPSDHWPVQAVYELSDNEVQ